MITWEERLRRAQKRGWFTKDDTAKAGEFNSCAVGEKLEARKLKLSHDQVLIKASDLGLYRLGMEFFESVHTQMVDDAIRTYHKIQAFEIKA